LISNIIKGENPKLDGGEKERIQNCDETIGERQLGSPRTAGILTS
jgi:hypothetical protein